jgi:hypothetical protein
MTGMVARIVRTPAMKSRFNACCHMSSVIASTAPPSTSRDRSRPGDHSGAFLNESAGDRQADAFTGAGHDREDAITASG